MAPTISKTPSDAGAQITRGNYHWGTGAIGASAGPISFGFRLNAPTYNDPDSNPQGTFTRVSAAEMAAAETAMRVWSSLAGITFSELNPGGYTDGATILFANYSSQSDGSQAFAYYPGSALATSAAGDVWLNVWHESTITLPFGSYDFLAVLHEVGHALGLQHPGDYNAGPGTVISYANSASYVEDTLQYSIMSYFDASYTGANHVYNGRVVYASTPLLDDITAIQRLYGGNSITGAGNTTYGFNSNADYAYRIGTAGQQVVFCIWDGSGYDTLDCSGYSNNQLLDLNAGAFSDIGALTKNVSIAIGVVIEAAVGGAGQDRLVGNDYDNALTGGPGDDTIDGRGGMNTAAYSGRSAEYQLEQVSSSLWRIIDLRVGRPDGIDSLQNVQFLKFADGVLNLALPVPPSFSWHSSPWSSNDFGWSQGWILPSYQRLVADIDQHGALQGSADYVAFGQYGVVFALGGMWNGGAGSGSGSKLFPGSYQINDFGTAQGYDQSSARGVDYVGEYGAHADAVWAQGSSGIKYYVAPAALAVVDDAGQAHYLPQFDLSPREYGEFGRAQGWDAHYSFDNIIISGDNYASVLGFGAAGLVVGPQAYAPGATSAQIYIAAGTVGIGNAAGWDSMNDVRTFKDQMDETIDLNGDGVADFVGMGPQGTMFAFGFRDGEGRFQLGTLQTAHLSGAGSDFGDSQGWRNSTTLRYIADVNGDGRVDILAFGAYGAMVALGQDPASHGGEPFGQAYLGLADFGLNQGWHSPTVLPRVLGDVNGDGILDIVGFGNSATYTALGSNDAAGKTTWSIAPALTIGDFGVAQGWTNAPTVRTLADMDGDGRAELVVSGGSGTQSWDLF
jgi:hypothetical protein